MNEYETDLTIHEALEHYCLLCEKLGHMTNECRSTYGLNDPRNRELSRLADIASAHTAPAVSINNVNAVWFKTAQLNGELAQEYRRKYEEVCHENNKLRIQITELELNHKLS